MAHLQLVVGPPLATRAPSPAPAHAWGAVFLDEGPINRRLGDLAGGDGHSVELTEARNQSRKPQGPVGLLQVHRVSRRCRPYKLINGVRNQLSHMHTHLHQNGINQLTLR